MFLCLYDQENKPIPKTDRIYDQENKPIPKTDRIIAHYHFHSPVASDHHKNKKNRQTTTKIPDGLWDEMIAILPAEKPGNTIGRPIFPYRKAIDGIVYVLKTGCQ